MRISPVKYKADITYLVSCLHIVKWLLHPRGNTTTCVKCGDRVFILETRYDGMERER